MHGLKDHARSKKVDDENDDDDDESGTMHRLLHSFLEKDIRPEDQMNQLKRQLQGQHAQFSKQAKAANAQVASEREKAVALQAQLDKEKARAAQLVQDAQSQIAALQEQCAHAESRARQSFEEERRKTNDSLKTFTQGLAASLGEAAYEVKVREQRMQREKELVEERKRAAEKQVAAERLRNALHERECLQHGMSCLREELERLKGVEQARDRQVAAVAEAVREEEREAAAAARKKVEEELAREAAESKVLNERIEEMDELANDMQVHEQSLHAKIDALFALAGDLDECARRREDNNKTMQARAHVMPRNGHATAM